MAKKTIVLTYDASRLVALAKSRDRHRAQMRALSDRYQAQRERLMDVKRRAALSRENAQYMAGTNRQIGDENAESLEAQADEIRAIMADLQFEIDACRSTANEAGRLLGACLTFAQDEKLNIPPALMAETAGRSGGLGGSVQ